MCIDQSLQEFGPVGGSPNATMMHFPTLPRRAMMKMKDIGEVLRRTTRGPSSP